jgi:hypothetical protein
MYLKNRFVTGIGSALTARFDGPSLRAPPTSVLPGTEYSVSNGSIRAALPEHTPLRGIILLFGSKTGPHENRLSRVVRSESSKGRNSRSDRSATGMIDVDYAMRPQLPHGLILADTPPWLVSGSPHGFTRTLGEIRVRPTDSLCIRTMRHGPGFELP